MLLAEANQWPEDAVAYFGDGDECHMAFHFPVMPRLYMALHMEDRFPIVDILQQTPAIPENSQWAIFLRNHDELTLEMVTDEDRDYMYRVYAQDQHARINLGIRRRLAPLLNHNRRRIEIMNSLLFSLPGTPVVYYGDEIGMGDNIYLGDRNGVRTPMQWSPDRNAGFSSGNPQQLYLPVIIDPEYHFESVNVESQQKNPHSLLWWMKRIFAMRKRFRAFSRGSIEFLSPENRKVLVFLRRWQDERILVVVNLSRFVQALELDLSPFRGLVPVEVFGRSALPPIGERPYFLTLGPHTFYWFTLEPERAVREPVAAGERAIPELSVGGGWMSALHDKGAEKLARILPAYLRERRWFASKARQILSAGILDTIELEFDGSTAAVTLVRVNYSEGDPDVYPLPLPFAGGEEGARVLRRQPGAVVARLRLSEGATTEGLLYDAAYNPAFGAALLDVIARRRRRNGEDGVIQGSRSRQFRSIRGPREERFEPQLLGSEQSNTSLCYGERMILKMFRRLDAGANPELEVGRFLTEQRFPAVPALAGAIEYVSGRSEPLTLAVLQAFVPNEGDAWGYTLDALHHYFDRVLARPVECRRTPPPKSKLLDLLEAPIPAVAEETIGGYLAFARLLGQRTAELHVALSSRPDDPAFAPEAISAMYRRSLYQYARSHCQRVLTLLRGRLDTLSGPVRDEALALLKASPQLNQRLHSVVDTKVDGMRIRCHGDYHLGQVMSTGKDFVIIDFEGEPARPISERRLKRSPLRDVAGMLRSFHYAASAALMDRRVRPEDVLVLRPCVDHWYLWVGATFVKAYMSIVQPRGLLPRGRAGLEALLDLCLLEKALYELAYELNHRPDWVGIPLRGIAALLEDTAQ
jgi:maltose alpha-D-glucosyltransferase/alpha-amylase